MERVLGRVRRQTALPTEGARVVGPSDARRDDHFLPRAAVTLARYARHASLVRPDAADANVCKVTHASSPNHLVPRLGRVVFHPSNHLARVVF